MSEEPGYGLVMPFVVVTSKGGPWDDQAYVAGYEMGLLDARLQLGIVGDGYQIHTWNIPQADLIAMRHGYTANGEISDDHPEWAFVTFEAGSGPEPTVTTHKEPT